MRVIAGKLRHREIKMTELETTRETQDKVRGAIFNMIGPYFDGGTCLDLFAGSGAMGIEAYSRGMAEVHFNDVEPKAIEVVRKNCQALKIEAVHYSCLDYVSYLKQNKYEFDYIFLDPPYKMNQLDVILTQVEPFLKKNGTIIFEVSKESSYSEEIQSLTLIKNKCYGIKRVLVYTKN